MNRPCIACGEPTPGTYCDPCRPTPTKTPAATRGYDTRWRKLSERARRLQPFCLHCGSTTDLQADHTPEAWRRHNAGLPIRLQDVQVLCGPCNRAAGAARGLNPRGETPTELAADPPGKAQGRSHMATVSIKGRS